MGAARKGNESASDSKRLTFGRRIGKFSTTRIIFIIIFVLVGSYFVFQAFAAPSTEVGGSGGGSTQVKINLTISPSTAKISFSQSEFTIGVYENSQTSPVNAVRAVLNYPTDKYDFVGVDTSRSAFTVDAEKSGGNGTVTIDRGNVNPLTGNQLVAYVAFKSKTSSGKAGINFTADSKLLSSTGNTNILQATSGATFSFTK